MSKRPSMPHMGDPCVICDARARGLSLQDIADSVGVSHTTIRTHTLGVETPSQKARRASLELLAAGVPYREITRRTGIFPSALVALNRRHELSVRKIGRPKLFQNVSSEQERVA